VLIAFPDKAGLTRTLASSIQFGPMLCEGRKVWIIACGLDGCIMYSRMAFPIKVCSVCSEEFELRPDKPGFANRCPSCSEPDRSDPIKKPALDADERKTLAETNEARRRAMRELLYRKDS
jgi:hypothetical protein